MLFLLEKLPRTSALNMRILKLTPVSTCRTPRSRRCTNMIPGVSEHIFKPWHLHVKPFSQIWQCDTVLIIVIPVEMEKWTKDKVFEWLQNDCILSRKQARKFLGQEIDGQALRCLTQEDLTKPPLLLKLGPAKRLLAHVQNGSGQIFLPFSFQPGAHHMMMLASAC